MVLKPKASHGGCEFKLRRRLCVSNSQVLIRRCRSKRSLTGEKRLARTSRGLRVGDGIRGRKCKGGINRGAQGCKRRSTYLQRGQSQEVRGAEMELTVSNQDNAWRGWVPIATGDSDMWVLYTRGGLRWCTAAADGLCHTLSQYSVGHYRNTSSF